MGPVSLPCTSWDLFMARIFWKPGLYLSYFPAISQQGPPLVFPGFLRECFLDNGLFLASKEEHEKQGRGGFRMRGDEEEQLSGSFSVLASSGAEEYCKWL